jgi:hypothetical protein
MPFKVNHLEVATDPETPTLDHDDWNADHVVTAPCTIVTKAALQAISAATWTALQFDTEVKDDRGWHDNATNNSRITVDQTGDYLVTGCWNSSGTGNGDQGIALRVNGTETHKMFLDSGVVPANERAMAIAQIVPLAAGDYVELFCFIAAAENTVPGGTKFAVKGL